MGLPCISVCPTDRGWQSCVHHHDMVELWWGAWVWENSMGKKLLPGAFLQEVSQHSSEEAIASVIPILQRNHPLGNTRTGISVVWALPFT